MSQVSVTCGLSLLLLGGEQNNNDEITVSLGRRLGFFYVHLLYGGQNTFCSVSLLPLANIFFLLFLKVSSD